MSEERHIELVWRCSSCQHQNLGRHTICQSCGNPKDDSEEYEMPVDPAAVASVTDPGLLELAKAGENWSCAYCGSDQRALDGGCKRCGAGKREKEKREETRSGTGTGTWRGRAPYLVVAGILGLGVIGILVGRGGKGIAVEKAGIVLEAPARTQFEATVTAASWKRVVTVETWQLVGHEDFSDAVPAGAVEVRSAGQHVHHQEQVLDHNETVFDDVEVPDGTRTESYTERVACGQDCKTTPRTCNRVCSKTPRTCRQNCTNKKNGFASCREECSGGTETCRDDCTGGTQSCTTKYCNEQRTRQIPKTRREKRARVVPHYRSEPRYAAWSTFKVAEWVKSPAVELTGEDVAPRWPDAGVTEPAGGPSTPKLGDKRVTRSETFSATLRTDDGATHPYVPASEQELATLAPSSHHQIRVKSGRVLLEELDAGP